MMDHAAQQVPEAHGQAKADLDGFVDRYFNRKVSTPLTRLFLQMGLSPNAITVLSLLIGLVAAGSFALGSYVAGIIGGLLFQLSAIVDCCDGEVARLTNRQSRFGRQLDLAADNLVHMAIFIGIAWGIYLQQEAVERSWLPLVLGAAAVVGNGFAFWLVPRALILREQRVWSTPLKTAWAELLLRNVTSRDFSVVLLIFALADKVEWFLWAAAIGVNVFWMIMAWVTRQSAIVRA